MQFKIEKENAFKAPKSNFIIGASTSGYILQYSADGKVWTDADTVEANTNWPVTNAPKGTVFRLKNNTANVVVTY